MDDQQAPEFRAAERTEPEYTPAHEQLITAQPMQMREGTQPGESSAQVMRDPVGERVAVQGLAPGESSAQVMRDPVGERVGVQGLAPGESSAQVMRDPVGERVGVQGLAPGESSAQVMRDPVGERVGVQGLAPGETPAQVMRDPEEAVTPRIGTVIPQTPADQGVPAQVALSGSGLPGTTPAVQLGGAPASVEGAQPGVPVAMKTPALQGTSQSSGSGSGSGSGAGQGFQVSPEQYQAAVSPMLAASEQVMTLFTALNSYLPSMESQAPWGKDESGKKFAEGEKGYLKYSADTLKALKGLPDRLKYIADGLKVMAQGYEGADSGVTSDLTGQDGQLSAVTPPAWSPSVHTPITPMNTYEHVNQSGRH
ncbi:hypothetical protein GCM10009760_55710 [Kitasatospora kazusensis]|uniref:WXG100 family type VII secretion target n=1 Tax=Kitasatospora kazusensis TaxID=407974 RepID=A0ABN3A8B4_9ACTN